MIRLLFVINSLRGGGAEKVLVNEDTAIIPLYQAGNTALQNTKLTGIQYHGAGVDSYRHMKLAA